jgi:hypothetical protein
MYRKIALVVMTTSLFAGCASVPMESTERSNSLKSFNPPQDGNAALYIYRSGVLGGALKKDVWLDGKCVGETAPDIFFYEEVEGGKPHKVSTESEFSPNDMDIYAEAGKTYFIEQYLKMGLFVGGADLKLVDETTGKAAVSGLKLAQKGNCSGSK